jgi:hypothetical protein
MAKAQVDPGNPAFWRQNAVRVRQREVLKCPQPPGSGLVDSPLSLAGDGAESRTALRSVRLIGREVLRH